MQIRRGTATAWATADPTLVDGELGFVTDAGKTAFKIGDGTNPWTTLPYVNATYPELPVDAGLNLDNSYVQGRYALLTGVTYTSVPADFTGGTTTQGNSLLLVTVPTNTIVIQELTTSLTPCKRWIRARGASVWTAWKRIDTLSASESLSITNLVLSGNLTVGGRLFVPPGYAAAPSITITDDTTTGIYQSAAQEIGIATNGVNRLKIGDSGLISTTTFNAVGVNAAASGITSSGGISVSSGTTALKLTTVNGALNVVSTTPANQLSVGSVTSALTQTVIKQNQYPAVAVFGRSTSDPSGLLFGTYNYLGTAVTTIRSDGVPTAGTDLTTKSYVDTEVSAVTFREIMIIGASETNTDYLTEGTVVTGVNSSSTSIPLTPGGTVPTITYFSNLPSSTVTWSAANISAKRRLVPSAGTWNVACGGCGINGGAIFTAIRTA
jgi:hypothetical protein